MARRPGWTQGAVWRGPREAWRPVARGLLWARRGFKVWSRGTLIGSGLMRALEQRGRSEHGQRGERAGDLRAHAVVPFFRRDLRRVRPVPFIVAELAALHRFEVVAQLHDLLFE